LNTFHEKRAVCAPFAATASLWSRRHFCGNPGRVLQNGGRADRM